LYIVEVVFRVYSERVEAVVTPEHYYTILLLILTNTIATGSILICLRGDHELVVAIVRGVQSPVTRSLWSADRG
jgi:hypothetical protein